MPESENLSLRKNAGNGRSVKEVIHAGAFLSRAHFARASKRWHNAFA